MAIKYKKAVSVEPNSPYNHPQAVECKALLNGVELEACVTANESEGWADVYSTDEYGEYIIDKENECLVTERVTGFVSIILPENWIGWRH